MFTARLYEARLVVEQTKANVRVFSLSQFPFLRAISSGELAGSLPRLFFANFLSLEDFYHVSEL